MRTSVFVRPTEVHYITLHEDLYRICRGNACAAMLMDYFIREHDRRLWEERVRQDGPEEDRPVSAKWSMTIQASVSFLCDILVWSYSKNTVSDAVKKLSEWGMIKIAKDRPKGREYDRRHYLTVDQGVVQGLFTDLSKGILPTSTVDVDFPNSVNQLSEAGKSLEEMNLVKEGVEETVAAEAAPLPMETSFPKSKAPVPHPKHSAPPPPTTKAKAPRPRNLIGEAMLEVCWGITDYTKATGKQWSFVASTIRELKEVQPDLTPEMIRSFAAQKRKEWDGLPFSPGAFLTHWKYIAAPAPGVQGEDPFPGQFYVTTAEVMAKFGNGAEFVRWRNRLDTAGRLKR
jgi:hypothetical protein